MGMVPPKSKVGDLVSLLLGAKTPYVLRRSVDKTPGNRDTYVLVGECYMDGMMDGEMMGILPRMERLVIV